jgi:hypothetical protein
MGKTWVLDTETKGTGANMVPLEKVQKRPDSEEKPAPARRPRPARKAEDSTPAPRRPQRPVSKTSTDLPPGHVRKRATGEIGKVEAVDSRAGTARVRWLKRGASSTVRLSEISRR